jgi:SNF2 family DNA or RNA helicase
LNSQLEDAIQALRPYQVEVVNRLVDERRVLNYMDMGMGKSLCTLLAVMELKAFPCLIICSKSAMGVLQEELMKWFEEGSIIYGGKPKQREALWGDFVKYGFRFIITNYSLASELGQRFGIIQATDSRGSKSSGRPNASKDTTPPGTNRAGSSRPYKWEVGALIADEIQLGGLFNHKTKTYQVVGRLAKAIPNVFLLTGTPYRRGVIDFYAPLSLVDPDHFDSYWKYVGKYCRSIDSGFGKSIERDPKDVIGFRKMIRDYAIILKKEDHLKELPGKQRIAVPLIMEGEQERVYRELEADLFSMTDGDELVISPGILAASVRLRQLLVAPEVLGLKERGAAIEAMLEMSEDLVEERKPFAIFTPFRSAVPFITSALRGKYETTKINTITGGLTAEEFTRQWKEFQDGRGSRILICVIKSGASFHATAADTCFFLGYEWDFNQNAQAEDRLNRIGQTKMVSCYYMLHRDSIDENVIQKLNDKKYSSDLVLSDEEAFQLMVHKRGGKNNE